MGRGKKKGAFLITRWLLLQGCVARGARFGARGGELELVGRHVAHGMGAEAGVGVYGLLGHQHRMLRFFKHSSRNSGCMLDCFPALAELVDEAYGERLLGADTLAQDGDTLGSRRPEEIYQARQRAPRERN